MVTPLPAWADRYRYPARPITSSARHDCRQCVKCVLVSHQDYCLASDTWINDGRQAVICGDFEAVDEPEECDDDAIPASPDAPGEEAAFRRDR